MANPQNDDSLQRAWNAMAWPPPQQAQQVQEAQPQRAEHAPPAPPAPTATDEAYRNYPPPAPGTYPPPPPQYGHAAGPGGYSPWWKRFLAALLDGAVIYVPVGILMAATGAVGFETDPVTGTSTWTPNGTYWAITLLAVVGSLLYYTLMEGGPRGATVGKLALGIQVRDESGEGPIGYGRALGRRLMASLLWWLLIIPGLLDVLSPLWDARRQTWHDKAVRSVVVDTR